MKKFGLILAIIVLVFFLISVMKLENTRQEMGKQQLEEALRRAAVACYAAEGFYPPNVTYLVQHYGLQYDETAYKVHYEVFASNLMPEITVVEKGK